MTRTRRALSRARVIDAALAIVDAEGLDALSMRRLGRELGVEAMSLYHHVRDKDDVVNALNVLVLSRIDTDTSGLAWPEALVVFAERLYAAYLPRPSLARALSWTVPTSRELLTTMERVLARLAESGLPPGVRVNAFRGVIASTVGFVLVHTDPAPTSESVAWRGWDAVGLSPADTPHLVELAPALETTPLVDDMRLCVRAVVDALVARSARGEHVTT
ncbi:MAG: TetR/AcrR family transcriptional regulator C-terminal domain-containing protein [Acidimicrobiales bacterium]|nr:TetR/AcrR family transcriptional regulator C-terminal domain-containing protein [Acidimicrobiales bacterium]